MKIFLEPIDRSTSPGAWFKFYKPIYDVIQASHELAHDPDEADIIIVHMLNNNDISLISYHKKIVILDWTDSNIFAKNPCLAYFKKSWTHNSNCFPLQEMALPEYFTHSAPRTIFVTCLLRKDGKGDKPNRRRVVEFLETQKLTNSLIGAVHPNKLGKDKWLNGQPEEHRDYLKILASAKIIVTCGPSKWQGDSRLWEALASGACVLSDRLNVDMGHNPIHGEHCFYYDELDDLISLIRDLMSQEEKCLAIGHAGRLLAQMHHNPAARLDQILSVIRKKICLP